MKILVEIPRTLDSAARESDRGNWFHRVVLKHVDEPRITVETTYGNGASMNVWNNVDTCLVRVPDGTADTSDLVAYLECDKGQALLGAIHEGHETRWFDGHERGYLSDEAKDAQHYLTLDMEFIAGDLPGVETDDE